LEGRKGKIRETVREGEKTNILTTRGKGKRKPQKVEDGGEKNPSTTVCRKKKEKVIPLFSGLMQTQKKEKCTLETTSALAGREGGEKDGQVQLWERKCHPVNEQEKNNAPKRQQERASQSAQQ